MPPNDGMQHLWMFDGVPGRISARAGAPKWGNCSIARLSAKAKHPTGSLLAGPFLLGHAALISVFPTFARHASAWSTGDAGHDDHDL